MSNVPNIDLKLSMFMEVLFNWACFRMYPIPKGVHIRITFLYECILVSCIKSPGFRCLQRALPWKWFLCSPYPLQETNRSLLTLTFWPCLWEVLHSPRHKSIEFVYKTTIAQNEEGFWFVIYWTSNLVNPMYISSRR